ncbi:MAG: efflux RND transporter permease subunit [Pseudomonadota bacterium]
MWLSDVSVKRPVFASVISLLLIAFGLLSFKQLSVREYPDVVRPVISIDTNYPGASAQIVDNRITELLEGQVAGIEGVRNVRSSSQDGESSISIEFSLERDIDEAANDVRDRLSRVADNLPEGAEPPEVSKRDSDARPVIYITANSSAMSLMDLTDFLERSVVDRYAAIPGVATVRVSSVGRPSLRIWVDRLALAARGLTVSDIQTALDRENVELPAGRIESIDREFPVRVLRDYDSPDDFRQLVISQGEDGHIIRLGEVARVDVAPRSDRRIFRTNGENSVGMGIVKQTTANTVDVIEAVLEETARLRQTLPSSISLVKSSDDSVFIRAAIASVYQTIALTTALVGLVIFLFLGSLRATVIPFVTIPVCLIASFSVLAGFGLSINLITLLALVLSIGLVVDDSIVVLENIQRRVAQGEPPLLAAFRGTRQVGFAVIATTAVLVAVFAPIAFLQDAVGRIFAELAVTLSAAVIFSSVLALSLVPVLGSKLLKARMPTGEATKPRLFDRVFDAIANGYARTLSASLHVPALVVLLALAVAGSTWFLLQYVPKEYAPSEDQGSFFAQVRAPEGTSLKRMEQHLVEVEGPMLDLVEDGAVRRALVRAPSWGASSPSSAIAIVTMAPWKERELSTYDAMDQLEQQWEGIPDLRVFTFMRSGLSSGGGGKPVQFVVGGASYIDLAAWRDAIIERARDNPGLTRVDSDLIETQPQLTVSIDKARAAALGVSTLAIGETLQAMMSDQRVASYITRGEEYDVILQAEESQRASPSDLSNIYVRSERSGELIPLASLLTISDRAGPAELNRYNRMRAVTISANLANGYSLGEALDFLEQVVAEELPPTANIDYRGESQEYRESSGSTLFTLGLAMLVVFLVLAAQFESFRHPLIIMLTVPLAIAGGLIGLMIFGKTLNIYSQIGVVMLIGIAAKNGILIVEFINQMRDEGMPFEKAIIEGARVRFRPVLMTAISTVMGAVPLILATGPGAESRATLGVVVFSGVSLATLLTLFVVPAAYRLIARGTTSPDEVARRLEELAAQS